MNAFYTGFDVETYPDPRRSGPRENRTPFEKDRDRIIFSDAFRRLQSKTQVFQSGEYDFYRTRLTHSLEVAQIGRGIAMHLLRNGGPLHAGFFIDPDLVEACCLAHDIGHPPFGHAGEAALNSVMAAHGGFEGNAQTLRILTALLFGDGGMQPTRALLDGTLKYKRLFAGAETPTKFLYAEQAPVLAFVTGGAAIPAGERNAFRSIECQIMDWADDVAYGLMDIVDGVKAHFISLDSLSGWRRRGALNEAETTWMGKLEAAIREGKVTRNFAMKVGDCIGGTSLRPRRNPLSERTHRHAFDLVIDPALRAEIEFYKEIAVDLIFRTPQIKQLEYKGTSLLRKMFEAMLENYRTPPPLVTNLVPTAVEALLGPAPDETTRARILCDYLSGMTDFFAVRTYRRLFDPGFGSIMDL